MRQRRYGRRVRGLPLAAAVGAMVLGLAAPTLAADAGKHRQAGDRGHGAPVLSAKRHYWRVDVNGQSRVVPAGGSLRYCVTGTVESMTPVVALTSPEKGLHVYAVQIIGPKAAGETTFVELAFEGKRTLVQAETRPVAFARLTRHFHSTGAVLPPGTYKLRLVTFPGLDARSGNRLVLNETLSLVPRQGC
jgi:hypothetical protein